MKKSLISAPILRKFNYGTITFLRHFFNFNQNFKMYQQQQQNQGQNYFKNNNANINVQQCKEDDALRNFRKWISLKNVAERPGGQIFTILNYNILSQKLLEQHSYLYNRHDKSALRWDQRLYNVIGEIFNTNPSILCFQVRITLIDLKIEIWPSLKNLKYK